MKNQKPKQSRCTIAAVLLGLLIAPASWANQPDPFFEDSQQIYDTELASQSGQGVSSTSSNNGNSANNAINIGAGGSLTNGDNVISGQAFSNSSGIATVIQNTGNNVLIQNSTIVNVNLQ
jgi:hypothetical protein